jgi:hypothetical protein
MQNIPVLIALIGAVAVCDACGVEPTTSAETAAVYSVAFDSGVVDSASRAAGTIMSIRVHVMRSGDLVAGAPVIWAITAGHGVLSADSTTTDTLGFSSINWRLGDVVELNTLSVASLGASATLRVAGIVGPASALVRLGPDSTAVAAGAGVQLGVRVVDRLGNGVPGAVVTWSASGGAFSSTSVTTDASGNAETTFTTAPIAATYSVTADLTGHASLFFKVVGL